MANENEAKSNPDQPMCYQIRIAGHLDGQWAEWFGVQNITPVGNGQTLLSGLVADQCALFGLLKKVRDLGLPLLAVNQVKPVELESKASSSDVPANSN